MKEQNSKNKTLNMKGNTGITLVALIITIIILLILAVVAIRAVNNTGIIQYAQNSADEYGRGQAKENEAIQGYMEYLDKYGNQKKDEEDKEVSIAGTYGYYTDTDDANYYVFNEGTMKDGIEEGTGVYVCWETSPTKEERKTFTYKVLADKTVVVAGDLDNEERTWKFEAKKDASGNIVNKMLMLIAQTGSRNSLYEGETCSFFDIYTTNGMTGLEKLNSKTYTAISSGDMNSISFTDNKMIITRNNGDVEEIVEYFVVKDDLVEGRMYILLEDEVNMYWSDFVIWNDTHIEVMT